ncbi:MAG: hypothetical protein M0Q91_14420 [Methanoregula sp.]|jgi:hypothetical protein|nr:hypothetical protein [Methanoregula sp.]
MSDLAHMTRDEITDTLEKIAKDIRIGNIGHPSWGEAKPLRDPLLTHNFFIILAKSPNWDTEDFGDLVLKMKSRKDREILCAVTDERNYDFLFNTLHEAGKKEVGEFLFENIEMVEDKSKAVSVLEEVERFIYSKVSLIDESLYTLIMDKIADLKEGLQS